ncbi:cell division protein [Klebsiella michiganensis]|nr:cell division protein [Klebsiella michiganensis]
MKTVLVVDASPDNMLRFFFNVDFSHKAGWARATIDGSDWRDAGLRYTSHNRSFALWTADAGRAREH